MVRHIGGGVSRYDGNRVDAIEAAIQRGEIISQKVQQDLKKINGKFVKSFTNYTTLQGLAQNSVRCIVQDKTGNLWFGTDGKGVSCYNPSTTLGAGGKTFTNYTTAQGLANNYVRSIMEDNRGNLWFGTNGGGVSRYDPSAKLRKGSESFTNFTTAQGLANNQVFSITQDKTGNLWFGTFGGGVSRYDGKSFMNFSTSQGLPDNSVTQILVGSFQLIQSKEEKGKRDCLVIGTNSGIAMLIGWKDKNGKVFPFSEDLGRTNNEELKNYTPVFEIYNSSNGYPVKDVNSGQNAMYLDSKGIIWIATGAAKTGLVRFDYNALHKSKEPPQVVIQNVKINQENICWFNFSKVSNFGKADSAANVTDSAAMLLAQFSAFGKTVSQEILDSQRTKFSGIQFDSITKFYPLPQHLVLPYKHNNVSFDFNAIETGRPYLVNYQYLLEGYDKDWNPVTKKTSATFGNIYEGKYTFKLKAQSPFGVWSEPIEYKFTVLPPWWRTWWMYTLYGLFAIGLIGCIVWLNGKRLRGRAKELAEEVRRATATIVEQKKVVEEKNKNISDSINYAQRIQYAMLPHLTDIETAFPQSFVLFKPKDIVSGDFYFFYKKPLSFWGGSGGADFFIAVADCTGHGVPGAFMSMIGAGKLNEAVHESSDTSQILSFLNRGIKTALKQSKSEKSTRDGMDIALCSVDVESRIVKYAAANRPIWIIRASTTLSTGGQTEVEEIKATKKAIGGFTDDNQHFETHEIKLHKGDTFYLFTDGYADTFSGKSNKKLTTKKFKEILLSIQNKTMQEQEKHLDEFMEDWKAGTEQVDDILVIGIRV